MLARRARLPSKTQAHGRAVDGLLDGDDLSLVVRETLSGRPCEPQGARRCRAFRDSGDQIPDDMSSEQSVTWGIDRRPAPLSV
jgi:hypothetical protein